MTQEAQTALKVLGPVILAAIVILSLAWKPWRRGGAAVTTGYWGVALACGVGAAIALAIITDWQAVQLKHRWHWLGPIALTSMAFGLLIAWWRPPRVPRVIVGMLTAVLVTLLFHPPQIVAQPWMWKAALGIGAFFMWAGLEPIAQRRIGTSMPLTMAIVFAGTSALLLQTNQAGFSLLAAALAAICGVGAAIAQLNRQLSFSYGGMYVLATMFIALLIVGWLYNPSEVSAGPFAVMAVTPFTLWFAEWRTTARISPGLAVLLRVVIVTIPVTGSVLWAMREAVDAVPDYGF